jgi:hypothetical protein
VTFLVGTLRNAAASANSGERLADKVLAVAVENEKSVFSYGNSHKSLLLSYII